MKYNYNEIVRVYTEEESGDFVRCSDCGELQLMQLGGTVCGECESENLQWHTDENGNEIQEISVTELEKMGFVIEKDMTNEELVNWCMKDKL